ncbi:MAG: DNA-binding protein [Candidatus Krumholzibacteria bacterium]|nr:DNA-binding protein [Candidatus Krumholzibacteria bacterium]
MRDWLANRWLVEHETNAEEIANLLALADRDLRDARSQELSVDWRFNIAYNAALQLAATALAAIGDRVSRSGPHHHRIIQSLVHTIGADENTVRLLDRFRKKRNVAEYDSVGTISDKEAVEIFDLALSLRQRVSDWLQRTHPTLLGEDST